MKATQLLTVETNDATHPVASTRTIWIDLNQLKKFKEKLPHAELYFT
jgi:hypothetical protein